MSSELKNGTAHVRGDTEAYAYDAHPPALLETLEARGVLPQLKARIRAEIFNAMDDHVRTRRRAVVVLVVAAAH
jgi:hypothetical protein